MFGFGKKTSGPTPPAGPAVSTKLCTDKFNGAYPHVGLYDVTAQKVWVAKPLGGQAIRTSHAKLITGASDATGTARKDRFICFWFYTPDTGSGHILGYPIDWSEAQLVFRVDPLWDYDRQKLIPPELTEQVDANLERQAKHGLRVIEFYASCRLKYPVSLHLVGQRATESQFYYKRLEPTG
ncbi:MAG: hypothetical protein QM754_09085 [Tepidisphaeraceae bacterium]